LNGGTTRRGRDHATPHSTRPSNASRVVPDRSLRASRSWSTGDVGAGRRRHPRPPDRAGGQAPGRHHGADAAYNGSVPGPTLKVQQDSEILVHVENHGDLDTTVHWHGLRLETSTTASPMRPMRPSRWVGSSPTGSSSPTPGCTGTTPTSARTTPRSWACTAPAGQYDGGRGPAGAGGAGVRAAAPGPGAGGRAAAAGPLAGRGAGQGPGPGRPDGRPDRDAGWAGR
jgi:hypothetical protein